MQVICTFVLRNAIGEGREAVNYDRMRVVLSFVDSVTSL